MTKKYKIHQVKDLNHHIYTLISPEPLTKQEFKEFIFDVGMELLDDGGICGLSRVINTLSNLFSFEKVDIDKLDINEDELNVYIFDSPENKKERREYISTHGKECYRGVNEKYNDYYFKTTPKK